MKVIIEWAVAATVVHAGNGVVQKAGLVRANNSNRFDFSEITLTFYIFYSNVRKFSVQFQIPETGVTLELKITFIARMQLIAMFTTHAIVDVVLIEPFNLNVN